MPTKSLGLDLSLVSTGYCTRSTDGSFKAGVIRPKKLSGMARLAYIRSLVVELLHSSRPDIIVIEGYSFANHGAHYAGEVGGLVRLICHDLQIPTYTLPPANLKQFVTGKGNAEKSDMKMQTLKRWNVELSDDNECDAHALSLVGLAALKVYPFGELNETQKKAVTKLESVYGSVPSL